MSSRHQKAGWYTPIDPDTRCNCGECFVCRLGQAQAKVDNAASAVVVAAIALDRAQSELEDARAHHAAALERLAEVAP